MEKVIEKWDEIINTVKREYDISDVSFDTWIRPLEIFAIEDNTIYILVPSEQMALGYISKKYLTPLRVTIVEITKIEYNIEGFSRRFCDCKCSRVGKSIIVTYYKCIEGIIWIQV